MTKLLVFVVAACLFGGLNARPLDEATLLPTFPAPWKRPYENEKPLIGILAQACHYCPGRSYVAGAFVKWVEAAGGRPVPIRFYNSDEELYRLFKSVNGLIFPGGLTDLWMDDPYVVAARKLWTWAKEANGNGTVFPIHGTCLGFQLLHLLEANVSYVEMLVPTDSVAYPSTLEFERDAAASSTMFGNVAPHLIDALEDPRANIALENHMFGLPPSGYDKFPALKDSWSVLSTALDRKGVRYVATAEHKKLPFFATQWHPEKPPFEFGMPVIPHSLDAVLVSQHLANTFIDVARRNPHKPESHEEEIAMLMYNYKPYFTLRDSVMDPSYDGPDMCYFFDNPHTEPDNELGTAGSSSSSSLSSSGVPHPGRSRMSFSFRGANIRPAEGAARGAALGAY